MSRNAVVLAAAKTHAPLPPDLVPLLVHVHVFLADEPLPAIGAGGGFAYSVLETANPDLFLFRRIRQCATSCLVDYSRRLPDRHLPDVQSASMIFFLTHSHRIARMHPGRH